MAAGRRRAGHKRGASLGLGRVLLLTPPSQLTPPIPIIYLQNQQQEGILVVCRDSDMRGAGVLKLRLPMKKGREGIWRF